MVQTVFSWSCLAKGELIIKCKGHKIDTLPSLWVRVLGTKEGSWPGFQGNVGRRGVLLFCLVRQEEFSSKFLLLLSSPLLYIPIFVPCN